MPLTHAERQKKFRKRQLEKHGEKAVKEKESKRRKEKRLANVEAEREKERERKRKSRQKKAESKSVVVASLPYKSASTLGKAVNPRRLILQILQESYRQSCTSPCKTYKNLFEGSCRILRNSYRIR